MKNNFNQTVNRNKFIEIQMSFNFFKQHANLYIIIFLSLREVNVKLNLTIWKTSILSVHVLEKTIHIPFCYEILILSITTVDSLFYANT